MRTVKTVVCCFCLFFQTFHPVNKTIFTTKGKAFLLGGRRAYSCWQADDNDDDDDDDDGGRWCVCSHGLGWL